MFQDTIKEIQSKKNETASSAVEIILQNPTYTIIIGICLTIILFYCIKIFFIKQRLNSKINTGKNPNNPPNDNGDDWEDVFKNIAKIKDCKELYKKLMKKVHPDNFSGSSKEKKALEISQELGKYKLNYMKLKEIEKVISDEFK